MIFAPEHIQVPIVIITAVVVTAIIITLDEWRWLHQQRRDQERRQSERFADKCLKSERKRTIGIGRWE